MAIPDYQTIMLPLLRLLEDEKEHSLGEVTDGISEKYQLSADDRTRLLESGQQTIIKNRSAWASNYLKNAGLLSSSRRGYYRITERGVKVLRSNPERIDIKFLEQFPEFVAFRQRRHGQTEGTQHPIPRPDDETPEEALDAAYQRLRGELDAALLEQVMKATPPFFERLVVELLVRMGYGGTLKDAGQAVGGSGDGGIDGIIKEDRLGLDVIYVQAKRWGTTVGRPEIQKFAGALQGHRARKGVFITTSSFSGDAVEYAARIDSKIVLIDGAALVSYMIDHGVGVSTSRSYEVKRIDSDYFSEE